jgi:hypothetical protein
VGVSGQQLGGNALTGWQLEHDVGERPADIDCQARFGRCSHFYLPALPVDWNNVV